MSLLLLFAGVGSPPIVGDGTSAGVATVSGEGLVIQTGNGASSGLGAVAGQGVIVQVGNGASAGVATPSGAGVIVQRGDGSTTAGATVSGQGRQIQIGNGSAAGVATANAAGSSGSTTITGDGQSSGSATAVAQGIVIQIGNGSAIAVSFANALGSGGPFDDGYVLPDFYSSLQDVAAKLIDKFGQDMIVNQRVDPAPVDPNKPWTVGAATVTSYPTRGVILDFRPDQVEGYAYQRGDHLCYIAAKDLATIITEEDTVIDASGTEWAIIQASRVYPSFVDILFQLYIRKWPRRLK